VYLNPTLGMIIVTGIRRGPYGDSYYIQSVTNLAPLTLGDYTARIDPRGIGEFLGNYATEPEQISQIVDEVQVRTGEFPITEPYEAPLPPIEPPIEPLVTPPIEPPIEPLVEPPIVPPVTPPVEPPAKAPGIILLIIIAAMLLAKEG